MTARTSEVAAAVRADIARARAAGDLGDIPAAIRISVHSKRGASGYTEVDIAILDAPRPWAWSSAYDPDRLTAGARTSEAVRTLARRLIRIAILRRTQQAVGVYLGGAVALEYRPQP